MLCIVLRDSEPCVGDVMRKFAPFLKLYSEYVKNFDNAMNTMTVWMDKSSRFMSIVREVQVCDTIDNCIIVVHVYDSTISGCVVLLVLMVHVAKRGVWLRGGRDAGLIKCLTSRQRYSYIPACQFIFIFLLMNDSMLCVLGVLPLFLVDFSQPLVSGFVSFLGSGDK